MLCPGSKRALELRRQNTLKPCSARPALTWQGAAAVLNDFNMLMYQCAKAMGQLGSIVALDRACESPGCQIELSKECLRKRLKLLLRPDRV